MSPPADAPFVAFGHYKRSASPDLPPKWSQPSPSLLQFWPPPSRGAILTPKEECSLPPPFLPMTSSRITTYYEWAGPPCGPADFISLSHSAFPQGNSATQHVSSPDTALPPPTWAPPSSPTRIGSAPHVSADTLTARLLTLSLIAPSGTSGRQGTCPPSAIVPLFRTSTTISQASTAPTSSLGGGTLTAVLGPLVWLPHGFNWRCVPTTPEYQSLRDALALYTLHHEEILPSVLAFELEWTLPASTPYYPVSMAYLDDHRLCQASPK
ncbi:hypothetical protein BOTBODRAFT_174075 [Botryobasidium botryosum FD-172 SS1]|uniref:Uncharacterized protein n=1 Tax=Botryobasidium botryosum (strain FD-172 SS1) TaxID=930990 RepID=A0A067MHG1_BOTB1|nr:hypothetical protein BOTBODRAFT_174075 [Botryobasidium botryosum FD-172 SS1]